MASFQNLEYFILFRQFKVFESKEKIRKNPSNAKIIADSESAGAS